MNDQVLTNDEKDALLDSVENGDIEVHTGSGRQYAAVVPFEVAPRNHIVSDSYPRLRSINRKLAATMSKSSTLLLNDAVEIAPASLAMSTWADFSEQVEQAALLGEIAVQPLDGPAVIHIQSAAVRQLVDTFYGGAGKIPPIERADAFTPGEINVLSLFFGGIIEGMAETWQSVAAFDLALHAVHQSTDIVAIIDDNATVICSEFELKLREDRHAFHIVWPTSTLTSLLPVLAGAKRERIPQEDARWERVLRERVPEASVGITSRIGNARMNLRAIAALNPGDIVDIRDPREGRVSVRGVPVFEGRFGVHDGRYAIEARRWLAGAEATAGKST